MRSAAWRGVARRGGGWAWGMGHGARVGVGVGVGVVGTYRVQHRVFGCVCESGSGREVRDDARGVELQFRHLRHAQELDDAWDDGRFADALKHVQQLRTDLVPVLTTAVATATATASAVMRYAVNGRGRGNKQE